MADVLAITSPAEIDPEGRAPVSRAGVPAAFGDTGTRFYRRRNSSRRFRAPPRRW
jgi:hypothetical protein